MLAGLASAFEPNNLRYSPQNSSSLIVGAPSLFASLTVGGSKCLVKASVPSRFNIRITLPNFFFYKYISNTIFNSIKG
jgi:hypothetical protein